MKHFLFLSFLFVLYSCVKEIPMHTWPVAPIIVVNSLITPDSAFSCTLLKISSLPDSNFYTVENADVKIYDSETGKFIAKLVYKGNGFYKANIKPIVGKSYKLKAKAQGFNPVEAITSVPYNAIADSIYQDLNNGTESVDGTNELYSEMNFTIIDTNSATNYYDVLINYCDTSFWTYGDNLYVDLDSIVLTSQNFVKGNLNFKVTDKVLDAENLWEYEPESFLFSDRLFNQSAHHFKIRMINTSQDYSFVAVLSASKEYYLYRKSWTIHSFNQAGKIFMNKNDFLKMDFSTHPIDMYSNIKGGYGIFAGYNAKLFFEECYPKIDWPDNSYATGRTYFNRTTPCNEYK